jgi:hypothetical protein
MQGTTPGSYHLKNCEGKGTLGCLFFLVLLAAMTLFTVKAGPPYFAYRGLEGDVTTEASRAGAHFFSNDVIIQNVLDVARKNEVPLKKENIKVERFAGRLSIVVEYRVPVDFILFTRTIDFSIKASSFIGTL